jgi:hypothetical protein
MKITAKRRASFELGTAGLGFASSEARLAISFPRTAQPRATDYVAEPTLAFAEVQS